MVCPKGTISRKSYVRKSGSRVHRSCVKSKALRSKGLRPHRVIPKLKSGSLKKFGYHVHESPSKRHIALNKALRAYGMSSLVHKLNAVRVLSRNTSPKNSLIYE